jgi:hypothetical protein
METLKGLSATELKILDWITKDRKKIKALQMSLEASFKASDILPKTNCRFNAFAKNDPRRLEILDLIAGIDWLDGHFVRARENRINSI